MALLRNTKEKNLRSVSFGQEQAERPHSVNREVNDLREDVELAFERIEGRDSLPEIHDSTVTAAHAQNSIGCVLLGINFLAGRSLASLTFDAALNIQAPGVAGNDISVTIIAGAGEAIAVNGKDIEITTEDTVSSAASIKTLIHNDPDAKKLVVASVVTGQGAIKITAASKVNLAGGSGDGFSAAAYNVSEGTSASIAQNDLSKVTVLSDTAITIAGVTLVADDGDKCAIAFESHTARSQPVLGAFA